MKIAVIAIVIGGLGTIPKGLVRGRSVGYRTTSRNHPNYTTKIGQNTERRLAVTQTPVKDHQLTVAGKLTKRRNNNDEQRKQLIFAEIKMIIISMHW